MEAVGVIALVAGLWLASPGTRPAGQERRLSTLGWVLAVLAGLLILTSPLTPASSPTNLRAPDEDTGMVTRTVGPIYPVPVGDMPTPTNR